MNPVHSPTRVMEPTQLGMDSLGVSSLGGDRPRDDSGSAVDTRAHDELGSRWSPLLNIERTEVVLARKKRKVADDRLKEEERKTKRRKQSQPIKEEDAVPRNSRTAPAETSSEVVESLARGDVLDNEKLHNDDVINEQSRGTKRVSGSSGCPLPRQHDADCSNCGSHSHVPVRKPKIANSGKIADGERMTVHIPKNGRSRNTNGGSLNRSNLISLNQVPYLIRRLEACSTFEGRLEILLAIRNHLYKMEHYSFVDNVLLNASTVMSLTKGLPRLFGDVEISRIEIPPDIKTDAKAIYSRWAEGDFDSDLLRGIRLQKRVNARRGLGTHATRSLIKDYDRLVACDYEGEGKLHNGQCWLYRICLIRDGAHGEIEAGIYGTQQKGCLAVVIAEGKYCDIDRGETLFYCSTEGKLVRGGDGDTDEVYSPSKGAKLLLKALKLGTKIRVIRSSHLPKSNEYRPAEGLRYDGLYTIKSHVILEEQKHIYRVKLVRIPGQDPIRYKGEMAKPSSEDLRRYQETIGLQGRAE